MMAGIQGEAAGPVYPKIPTVWKRNRDTGKIRLGDYAMPELEYLHQNVWWFFEKIDGTNIRLHWDGEQVLIGGRTNNAQIPAPLHTWLMENIPPADVWRTKFDGPVTVYGEGFGRGIQSGNAYGDTRFIVFDVLIEHWWLHWDDVVEVAGFLGFETVPFLGEASIGKAVHNVSHGLVESRWPLVKPEGLVGRTRVELQTRSGQRLLVKIKSVDYTQ
jgi:hypothetical protein